jgi:hypothetical protein
MPGAPQIQVLASLSPGYEGRQTFPGHLRRDSEVGSFRIYAWHPGVRLGGWELQRLCLAPLKSLMLAHPPNLSSGGLETTGDPQIREIAVLAPGFQGPASKL